MTVTVASIVSWRSVVIGVMRTSLYDAVAAPSYVVAALVV